MDCFEIIIPEILKSVSFEEIFKTYYYKSKLKKNNKICFNFEKNQWVDLFELCLITIWILELHKREKTIRIILPTSRVAQNFLYDYEFINLLIDHKILPETQKYKKPYNPKLSPMFPLSFKDEKEFQTLLDELRDPKRSAILLRDISDAEIVRKNAIHTVILKEISENIFKHSHTSIANFALTKLGSIDEQATWDEVLLKGASPFEKNYFEELNGNPFIYISLCDNGNGIYNTLLEAYKVDKIIPAKQKKEKPNECDIIEYAFLRHSTSKSDEERKKELRNKIGEAKLKIPLITGLYKVLSIVKQYQGLLYVRSGSSIVCFNYYGNTNIVLRSDKIKGFGKLTRLTGTQFKMYFPLFLPRSKKSFATIIDSGIKQKIELKSLWLDEYIGFEDTSGEQQISMLQQIETIIEKLKLEYKNKKLALIVDLSSINRIYSKNIVYYLIASFMLEQSLDFSTIFINLDFTKSVELDFDFKNNPELKPVQFFDPNFNRGIVGLKDSFKETYKRVGSSKVVLDDQTKKLLNAYSYIFLKKNNLIQFRFSAEEIKTFYLSELKKKIKNRILSPNLKIYHKNLKVLIPDKYYVQGFFEIANIFTDYALKEDINKWLNIIISDLKDTVIITVGENIRKLLKQFLYKNDSIPNTITTLHIETPINVFDVGRKILDINSGGTVILTDVIGSGTILKQICELVPLHIQSIYTLINTNSDHLNELHIDGQLVKIDYIFFQNLSYYPKMPAEWMYNEISVMNTKTNRIIPTQLVSNGPLWIRNSTNEINIESEKLDITVNEFISCIVDDVSFISGHFLSNYKHILYFFNIPYIVKKYGSVISEIIFENIKNLLPSFLGKSIDFNISPTINTILFPAYNPGLLNLAQIIASKFIASKILSVDAAILDSDIHQADPDSNGFNNEPVIILDDAFDTGGTILKLIEYCSSRGATHIFIYTLIKRCGEYNARILEGIKQFNKSNIQFRYLVDIELPTYNEMNCPICKSVKEHKALKNKYSEPDLKKFHEYLNSYINNNEILEISNVPLSEVNVDDSILYDTQKTYSGLRKTELTIRIDLELATHPVNINHRKKIDWIIKSHKKNPKEFFALLKILANESSYFFNNVEIRKTLFYTKLQNNLLNTLIENLKQIKNLEPDQMKYCLVVLAKINENALLNGLSKFVIECGDDQEKIFNVFYILLNLGSKDNYTAFIPEILQGIQPLISENESKKIIDKLIIYSNQIRKDSSTDNIKKVFDAYNEARLLLHNIRHHIDAFEFIIEQEDLITGEIYNDWTSLETDYKYFEITFKSFVSYLKINKTRNIHSIYNSLLILSLQHENLKTIFDKQNLPILDKTLLKQIFSRISNLIYDPNLNTDIETLTGFMDRFDSDIKAITFDSIKIMENSFKYVTVKCDYSFPDKFTRVFGDYQEILLVFLNVIENVFLHSGAQNLFIKGLINNNELDILFLNDGIVPHSYVPREGFKVIDKVVKKYGGKFYFGEFTINDSYYKFFESTKLKFTTVTKITLLLIE